MARQRWVEDVLNQVSEETGFTKGQVTKAWNFVEDQLGSKLKDPHVPKIIMNGFFKFQGDIQKVQRKIFYRLHRIRKSKYKPIDHREHLITLLKVRSRLIKEDKSWDNARETARKQKEKERKENERRKREIIGGND